jgi:hypothetical protein
MAVTRWPDVVAALITLMRATAGYRDPSAYGSEIPVYDSFGIGRDEQPVDAYLVIAWAGDPDSLEDGGDSGQGIATLGNNTRDEKGTVRCRAVGQYGTGAGRIDPTAARATAFAVMGAVETLLRGNPTLGIVAPRMLARIGQIESIQQWANEGPCCALTFTVTYDTRI